MGIHYERAWAFRSKVEVVIGEEVDTRLSDELKDLGRLKEMKRRMNRALEEVGVNFASEEDQMKAETLAYASTLGTSHSYFNSLKSLEPGVPEDLQQSWDDLTKQFAGRRPLRHQRVALFPGKSRWLYAAAFPFYGLPVLVGLLLNAPPLILATVASWKLADEKNVIALWRLLVGVPLFVIWVLLMVLSLGLWVSWWWVPVYFVITVISLETIYRIKKVGASAWNAYFHADQSAPSWKFHAKLNEFLSR